MTEDDVAKSVTDNILGMHVKDVPSVMPDGTEFAYLADCSAAMHVSIRKTEQPPFTTIKFAIHLGFDDGFASNVISVQRGIIAL